MRGTPTTCVNCRVREPGTISTPAKVLDNSWPPGLVLDAELSGLKLSVDTR